MDTVTLTEPLHETLYPFPLVMDVDPDEELDDVDDWADDDDEWEEDSEEDSEEEEDDWDDEDDDWDDDDEEWDDEDGESEAEDEEEDEDDDWDDDEPLLETRFLGIIGDLEEEKPRIPKPSRGTPHDRRDSHPRGRRRTGGLESREEEDDIAD